MNTTQTVVITSVLVVAGRWQQEKPITVQLAVGGGMLAVGLGVLSGFNEPFARVVAYMVLVAAVYQYLPDLVKGIGFTGAMGKESKGKRL